MPLRLKMKVGCTTTYAAAAGEKNTNYRLDAVYGEANQPWSKFTPSGRLDFTITNPAAEDLENGREYFVPIEAAD